MHMARCYHGVTLQGLQHLARTDQLRATAGQGRRARRRVEFIEDDYRNATGRCDAVVSVGMLEHVGRAVITANSAATIDRCLKPGAAA